MGVARRVQVVAVIVAAIAPPIAGMRVMTNTTAARARAGRTRKMSGVATT
jgi:hypothetical protein